MADVEVEVNVGGETEQPSETGAAEGGEPQVTESPPAEQGEKEEEGEKEAAGEAAGEESDSDEEVETEEQKPAAAGDEPLAEPQAAGERQSLIGKMNWYFLMRI